MYLCIYCTFIIQNQTMKILFTKHIRILLEYESCQLLRDATFVNAQSGGNTLGMVYGKYIS